MRSTLRENTQVRMPGGEVYKIKGEPIGEGGGSLIYPVVKLIKNDDTYVESMSEYVLKECFPLSARYEYKRNDNGEIVADSSAAEAKEYLDTVKRMLMDEYHISEAIYKTGFRLTPTIGGSLTCELSFDEGKSFVPAQNAVTIMESLAGKGQSLKSYLKEQRRIPLLQSFRIIEQVLMALKEVHKADYIHLDIQDGNVFIKGNLEDSSNLATLIDFGSSRALLEDGKCAEIKDRVIFSTQGFAAPEMVKGNDGTLRLGPQADIYSVGYLLLYLLTGQKYNGAELEACSDGHYITRMKLRKIKCPKHLVETMQNIIAGCLETEPEKRYKNCDEALAAVSDFIQALSPYRSDLAQVKYDAFICYKHGETDSAVAKELQFRLEHFKRKLSGEKKKIKRVFLDEGELASCADFGLQIREALKNAGWLIVVCSKDTKNSPWVNLEIETFLEYHDRSRILAVMTDGEPKDIFPEALLGGGDVNEVLAADARENSTRKVIKKLRKNALLKIIAPMIGTTYDTLYQRNKIYAYKKAFITVVAIMAILLAAGASFFSYRLRQMEIIAKQAEEIEQQYNTAVKNQARYLSEKSIELYNSGDRDAALLTALAIETSEGSDGPVVPEQMYALNTALGSYKSGFHEYSPVAVGEIKNCQLAELSPNNEYYVAADDYNIYLLSPVDGSLIWKADIAGQEEGTSQSIKGFHFIDDTRIFVRLRIGWSIIDTFEKTIEYAQNDRYLTSGEYCVGNDVLVNLDYKEVEIYDIHSGITNQTIPLESYFEDSYAVGVALSNDNRRIAVAYSGYRRDTGGLIEIDIETGETTVVSDIATIEVMYTNNKIVALHEVKPDNNAVYFEHLLGNDMDYYWVLYDPKGEHELYRSAVQRSIKKPSCGCKEELINFNGIRHNVLFYWIDGSLYCVDVDDGKFLSYYSYYTAIQGVEKLPDENDKELYDDVGDAIAVGLYGGYVNVIFPYRHLNDVTLENKYSSQDATYIKTSLPIDHMSYNYDEDTFILLCENDIYYYRKVVDNNYELVNADNSAADFVYNMIERIEYYDEGDNSYRAVTYDGERGIAIFETENNECIYHYSQADIPDKYRSIEIVDYNISSTDGVPYLIFLSQNTSVDTDHYTKYNQIIHYVNLKTGEEERTEDITKDFYKRSSFYDGVFITKNNKKLFMNDKGTLYVFDLDTLEYKDDILLQQDTSDTMNMSDSYDGQYVIIDISNSQKKRDDVYCYSVDTGETVRILSDINYKYESYKSEIVMAQCSNRLALLDKNNDICVYDYKANCIVDRIAATPGAEYAFFDNDNYLLIYYSKTIFLYDLYNKKYITKYGIKNMKAAESNFKFLIDGSSSYFAISSRTIGKHTLSDEAKNAFPSHIFYVDENHQIYQYVDLSIEHASFEHNEIITSLMGELHIYPIYTYDELKGRALEILKGRTLTDEERGEYFINEQ